METFLLQMADVAMSDNAWVYALLSVTGTSTVASIFTAFTKTRQSKWYKLIELIGFVVKHAKEKYEEDKKGNK